MKLTLILTLLLFFSSGKDDKIRTIDYNGKSVKTTFEIPVEFYGKYAGQRDGYLLLKEDGTGEYNYDVFGFAPSNCKKDVIRVEWGFLLDENNQIVSFEREYGRSYPVLFKSIGATSFQGCRKQVMLDFVMQYKNGHLGVSSSDDWVKKL